MTVSLPQPDLAANDNPTFVRLIIMQKPDHMYARFDILSKYSKGL